MQRSEAKMKTKVMLVDDHKMIRSLLRGLLDLEPGIQVVAEARDGQEGLQLAEKQQPDVIITDLKMTGMDGLEMARKMRGNVPASKVIILSMYADPVYVNQAMEAGAHGYVLKGGDLSELVRAIHNVASGQRYFSPSLIPASSR
jgi:DNA-binding NarL/FixJ family response regulator